MKIEIKMEYDSMTGELTGHTDIQIGDEPTVQRLTIEALHSTVSFIQDDIKRHEAIKAFSDKLGLDRG